MINDAKFFNMASIWREYLIEHQIEKWHNNDLNFETKGMHNHFISSCIVVKKLSVIGVGVVLYNGQWHSNLA